MGNPFTSKKRIDGLLEKASDFIDKNKSAHESKPFYVNLWIYPTHSYINPTPEQLAVYKDLKVDINDFSKQQQEFLTFVSKQNTKIKVLSLFTPIKNDADQIVRILFLGDNISYREELEKKQELTATEKLHLQTRIGINSGPLVAGNIGGEKRMDYTAIGDTTNLSARMESMAEPGTVMVIDPAGGSKLRTSTNAYDTTVAGIVSTAPGVSLGTKEDGNDGEKLIAVAGRVPCKVDASYAPIMPGDLLTTSDTPGHAMKATDPAIGTILGKALEPLDSGIGTIEVLVTLQ